MKLRVVKHEADDEKGTFKVVLKGDDASLVEGCLVECELRLKGKSEKLLETFHRGARINFEEADE